MSEECTEFVKVAPSDQITAELFNNMQLLICESINEKVASGVASVTDVENAENAEKLGGKTAEELCREFLEKALQAIPERTGYLKVFKRLKIEEVSVIEHNLKVCPEVDVYALNPFEVVCAVDEDKSEAEVLFFLYHTSEKKIRSPAGTDAVEIENGDLPVQFKISLAEVLEMFDVPFTNDSSVGDLETELWKAMFAAPNDDFDMDDYCHSPWFERCCREERTVESLKKKGDWDDLWLKMVPRKTINWSDDQSERPYPIDLNVVHFNMNTVGLLWKPGSDASNTGPGNDLPAGEELEEQKLMVILKV